MSAVADATLAIACSQSNELPSALDLRSTALHGIRHYKLALSGTSFLFTSQQDPPSGSCASFADLDDAALIDPVKGVDWLPRLLDMRRLVPESSRMRSKFAQRMALEGLPVPPPPPPPIAPVPKYSRKPRLELTASADEGKPNGKVVGRIEATKQSNGGIKPHGPPKELGPDDELSECSLQSVFISRRASHIPWSLQCSSTSTRTSVLEQQRTSSSVPILDSPAQTTSVRRACSNFHLPSATLSSSSSTLSCFVSLKSPTSSTSRLRDEDGSPRSATCGSGTLCFNRLSTI